MRDHLLTERPELFMKDDSVCVCFARLWISLEFPGLLSCLATTACAWSRAVNMIIPIVTGAESFLTTGTGGQAFWS